jgi:hypothetical protein
MLTREDQGSRAWRFTETPYNLPMPQLKPLVAIIMGSKSDWETMRRATETLDELGVPNEARVLSAHRTPDATADFARKAVDRGFRVIIAGAGGAAHLAGVIAAHTWLPVLGVPIQLLKCQAVFPSAHWRLEKPAQKTQPSSPLRFSPPPIRRFARDWKDSAKTSPKRYWPRNCQSENIDFNRPRCGG